MAGLFAAGQFLFKMMFAEEREKALTEIKWVAPGRMYLLWALCALPVMC